MKLEKLKKIKGNKPKKDRVGRGSACGEGGHMSGRGNKGQKSRTGYNIPRGFEGGQSPIYKRMPETGGFKKTNRREVAVVSLDKLNIFSDGSEVSLYDLLSKKIVKTIPSGGIKILDKGDIKKKLTLKGFLISKSAAKKLEKIGGKVIL